jgi:hypothetical protein
VQDATGEFGLQTAGSERGLRAGATLGGFVFSVDLFHCLHSVPHRPGGRHDCFSSIDKSSEFLEKDTHGVCNA